MINVEVKTPSARGAATLYKVRFKNLITGENTNETFEGDDEFEIVECERVTLQYMYKDEEYAYFMDTKTFLQYNLPINEIKEDLCFMLEGMNDIIGLISNETLLAIQLPATVVLKVVECPPEMKNASASARTKPATLETGLVIQVPEYIERGMYIEVNTETRQFVSRV